MNENEYLNRKQFCELLRKLATELEAQGSSSSYCATKTDTSEIHGTVAKTEYVITLSFKRWKTEGVL